MNELIIIFIGTLIPVFLIGWVFVLEAGQRKRFVTRAKTISERVRVLSAEETAVRRLRRYNEQSSIADRLAKRLIPRPSMLRLRLLQTGRDITIGRYVMISLSCGICVAIISHVVAGLAVSLAALIGLAATVALPHIAIGTMIGRRQNRFIGVFPDAIDLMVRGLRSGLPVTETIAACGREMIDPVGPEFRRIADSVTLGQTLEDALWDAARRLDIAEFKFFVISLSVQKETGGNLAETLANLSEILRSRRQMKLKVKAMSSEARASALILGSLPFVMFVIIYLMSPDYISLLFTDQRGHFMLGGGLAMMTLGGFVMHRMVRFEI